MLSEGKMAKFSDEYQFYTGLVIPTDRAEDKCSIVFTSSLRRNDDNSEVFISAPNLSDNQITLYNLTELAHFDGLIEPKANDLDNFIEIDLQLISLAEISYPDYFETN